MLLYLTFETAELKTSEPIRALTTEDNAIDYTGLDTRHVGINARHDGTDARHAGTDIRHAGMKRRREDCGPGDLHGPRATIESPYNAGYYHLYFHCWWTMHVTPNTTVRLEFKWFDLYTGHDYVIVHDGSKDLTGRLTGRLDLPYYVDSTSDTMTVEYVTDIAFTTNGFRATLQEVDNDTETTTVNYVQSTSDNQQTTEAVGVSNSSDFYVRAISTQCDQDDWDIRIYLPNLYKLHSDFDPSDIYLGRPGCEGYRSGDYLLIHQQYTNCLTHLMTTPKAMEYTNMLVYAFRDPNHKFIVRDYRFKIDVHCDLPTQETVSQHFIETHNKVRTRSRNPIVSGSGHYNVHMSFYRDPAYRKLMTGSPLLVNIGEEIYVTVTTPLSADDVIMNIESCYTLPFPNAGDHLKFYLIKNGCSSDVSSRVLNKSSHVTRFVFRNFEYTNQDNLYLFCTATFCNENDNSSASSQSCHRVHRRAVQSEADIHLQRADTFEVIRLTNGYSHLDLEENLNLETSDTIQYISVNDYLSKPVLIIILGAAVIGILVAIRRSRKPRTQTIENI